MNSDIPYLALYTVNVFFKVYLKRRILAFIKIIVMASSLLSINNAFAETANDINKDASQALANLYKSNKVADELSKRAVAVLVFPNIIKAGLIFDGSYGEGVLGSVDLLRLNLQQFVWYLGKAEPMWCGYSP